MQIKNYKDITKNAGVDLTFKDRLKRMLECELQNNEFAEFVTTGICPNENKVVDVILAAQIEKAMRGDDNAFKNVRDSIGEKPSDRVEENRTVRVIMDESIKEYGE